MLDCFALLDWVGGKSANASFTAAAFKRLFAEAARVAQHGELYLFFIRRALEVAPLMLPVRSPRKPVFAQSWQAILVLCHEGAHALAPDHEMRKAIEDYATLSTSSMMNEMIAGLTGQLDDLLEGEQVSSALRADMESWAVVRHDLQIGMKRSSRPLRQLPPIHASSMKSPAIGSLRWASRRRLPSRERE